MANKRSKQRKPKQSNSKQAGQKGGAASFEEMGSPTPVRKKKAKQ